MGLGSAERMTVGVLGPVTANGSEELPQRDRMILGALSVREGSTVTTDELAAALWPDLPPPSWRKVVQSAVVRLRQALGPDAIRTVAGGYILAVEAGEIDALRFGQLVDAARAALDDDRADRAARHAQEALALWRGDPHGELANWPPARAAASRLEQLHESAQDLYLAAMIRSGRAAEIADDAGHLARLTPYREARWGLWAHALYLSSRQAEALEVMTQVRTTLRDELGVDPGAELAELEVAILRQDPALMVAPAVDPSAQCPWPGLAAYGVDDAASFFGRSREIAASAERLECSGALVVVGPSGCGKSSLVRAGLAPRLTRAGHEVLLISPGRHPMATIEGAEAPTAIVVDQAEELVTQCDDPAERERFVDLLADHHGPVVLTARGDYLDELATSSGFAALLDRGLFVLGPMDDAGLRATIEEPAAAAGLRLEPGFTELLLSDCAGEPGALPLLSHALAQSWNHIEGNTLTVDSYRATGGLREAISRSADDVFGSLDSDQQDRMRSLFQRLVDDDGGEPFRTSVPRADVPAPADVVERLVAARLLSATDGGELQIAHEALVRHWPRLREWLAADRDGRRTMRHLSTEARGWDLTARPESSLYRGIRLDGALEWAATHAEDLTDLEREFLAASRAHADEELRRTVALLRAQRRANSRLRIALAVAALLLVAAVSASVVSIRQTGAARTARDRAQAAERRSQALRIGAIAAAARNPTLAFALAAQGLSMDDSEASRRHALEVFSHFPGLVSADPAPRSTDGLVLGESVVLGPSGGRRVEIDTTRSRLTSYDERSGKLLAVVTVPGLADAPQQPGFAALSEDGRTLAVATPVQVRLLDAATLEPLRAIPVSNTPNGFAFSSDGQLLAWGLSEDGFVDEGTTIVYDLGAGQEVMRVKNGDEPLWAHSFAADGATVTASGPDGSRTWALHPVRGVIRDGKGEIVSFRLDTTLISPWDDSVQSWIAEACRLAGRGLTSDEWRASLGVTPASPVC